MMDPAAVTIVDTEEGAAAHGSTNKSQHNAVFCAWLCRVYGQDYLRTKRGVADVAGGQGYLSYELCIRYGVPSTVIDPRPTASQKLNGMLGRKMKRITKNRLKEKQRKLCFSCTDTNGSTLDSRNPTVELTAEISETIDAIDGKPGIKLSDATSTESWTDLLFSDVGAAAAEEEIPVATPTEDRIIDKNECLMTRNKSSLLQNTLPCRVESAAAVDERNPLFQFLASSSVFRSAVYEALGAPAKTEYLMKPTSDTDVKTEGLSDSDPGVLPLDDLTVLPSVLSSCGLSSGSSEMSIVGANITVAGLHGGQKIESILENSKRVVPVCFPPFRHHQSTFSDSRGERPYCDVVTGKTTAPEEIVVKVSHNHRMAENDEIYTKDCSIFLDKVSCDNFSVLVGMHSDQATEEIVDLALAHDMPFSVVPCCVFPKLFSHRKIPISAYRKLLKKDRKEYADIIAQIGMEYEDEVDNKVVSQLAEDMLGFVPVVTYEQFIMFLMLKSPKIRCVDLPFEGRNTVLYTLPAR